MEQETRALELTAEEAAALRTAVNHEFNDISYCEAQARQRGWGNIIEAKKAERKALSSALEKLKRICGGE